jgi:hypothetical protein
MRLQMCVLSVEDCDEPSTSWVARAQSARLLCPFVFNQRPPQVTVQRMGYAMQRDVGTAWAPHLSYQEVWCVQYRCMGATCQYGNCGAALD